MLLPIITALLGGLRVDHFSNAAFSGPPSATTTVDSFDLSLPNFAGSAEISGNVTFPKSSFYSFECNFSGGQLVFVWISDHLICHTDPPFGITAGSIDGSAENPLWAEAGSQGTVLVHVVYGG